MERAVAVTKLRKLLGKNFGYRIDPKAASREEREAAQEARKPIVEEWKRLGEQKEARLQAVLAADAEYQRLKAAHKELAERKEKLLSIIMCYRITVGTVSSLFFHVDAQGDSWEDVIAKVQQKQAARR